MRDGVEVYKLTIDPADGHEEKHILGKSSKAGQTAVMQSAASRVFTNVSVSIEGRHPLSSGSSPGPWW